MEARKFLDVLIKDIDPDFGARPKNFLESRLAAALAEMARREEIPETWPRHGSIPLEGRGIWSFGKIVPWSPCGVTRQGWDYEGGEFDCDYGVVVTGNRYAGSGAPADLAVASIPKWLTDLIK